MKETVNYLSRRAYGALAMIAVCVCGAAAQADGGGLRDPNPQEKAVLIHYREVINKVLNQFRSNDWDEKIDYEITDDVSISSDPDVPLDVNEMFQRSYNVKQGSALWQREVAPIVEKLTATTDPTEMARIAKQRKMTNLTVEVHFDRSCVGMNPTPGANSDLHIPGAALAYRLKPYKFERGTSVVLLFGNWKTAKWNGENGCERYQFKHGAHQAAIENVVIQLDGSPERTDELLHSVDWKMVNEALTEKP